MSNTNRTDAIRFTRNVPYSVEIATIEFFAAARNIACAHGIWDVADVCSFQRSIKASDTEMCAALAIGVVAELSTMTGTYARAAYVNLLQMGRSAMIIPVAS